MKDELQTGYDLVLLIYPRPETSTENRAEAASGCGTLAESAGQLKTLFKKAGLFRQEAEHIRRNVE